MNNMSVIENDFDFTDVHAAMQRNVDADLLAGLSCAVLVGRDLVDVHCAGMADREAGVGMRSDHIHRVFSNTKLVTSICVLMLMEEGKIQLDDPIETYLPQLANMKVLKPGATSGNDTEPASSSMTIRHLLTHSSGLSYGLFDPTATIAGLYTEAQINSPMRTLSQMVDDLGQLPLNFHPGTAWEYSVATDVLGRLLEVMTGDPLDKVFQTRVFDPIGMVDTGFYCPEEKHDRMAVYYAGADLMDPMKPGLSVAEGKPYLGAYMKPFPKLSGGGGLVSTLPDMVALIRSLLPAGENLLQPSTLELIKLNQLPTGRFIRFAGLGELPGRGFGLVSSITETPLPTESAAMAGEVWWGGVAGTQWWVSPKNNLSCLIMTQRVMGFAHPFAAELKNLIYKAVVG